MKTGRLSASALVLAAAFTRADSLSELHPFLPARVVAAQIVCEPCEHRAAKEEEANESRKDLREDAVGEDG